MRKLNGAPYWRYLERFAAPLSPAALWAVRETLRATPWQSPTCGAHWNNLAALLLAQACLDGTNADALLRSAREALKQSARFEHPLAAALLSACERLQCGEIAPLGDALGRLQLGLAAPGERCERSLVFLPPGDPALSDAQRINALLTETDGRTQALRLSAALAEGACPFPLEATSQRMRALASRVGPSSWPLNLRMGVQECHAGRWEGIALLQRAAALAPEASAPLHALYLACRDIGATDAAQHWLTQAHSRDKGAAQTSWRWVEAAGTKDTWVQTPDGDIAAPATLRSLSTATLLCLGDWFEGELSLWRRLVKPGMGVVDAGASMGVYSLAAARRVGSEGRLFAFEPHPEVTPLLQRTLAPWHPQSAVSALALSNASGVGWLCAGASELSGLVRADADRGVEVKRQTLDKALAAVGTARIDVIKLDVEGHELSALQGALQTIQTHQPLLIFENLRPGQRGPDPSALLDQLGYRRYRWNRHLQRLESVDPQGGRSSSLNLVALPAGQDPASLELS